MWVYMKALSWQSLNSEAVTMETPGVGTGQPQRFIPVFETFDDAEKFAGGEIHLIREIEEVKDARCGGGPTTG
jgi:hypothetical protein